MWREHELASVRQVVQVESGFGYGVIGADLHVFQDGGPVYLLAERQSARPEPDAAWLLEQPSRMLAADLQIVDFTGREQDRASLADWRDHPGPRLAARWLHAPGGQGKTRLAVQFAADSAAADWKVVTATHTAGRIIPPPGSQNMSLDGFVGLLLIVDYADRWPLSHLAWLFSNALFHHRLPTRLLLLARSAQSWIAVRKELTRLQAATSDHPLPPLTADIDVHEREKMFTAARDCFARRYRIDDPAAIKPPAELRHPDFGLTLALHMSALVKVDAHTRELKPPKDVASLSGYLLDREHEHWKSLYENRVTGLEFRTPHTTMARTVFTAALTGAAAYDLGVTILDSLKLDIDSGRVLTDHAVCYPPTDAAMVLAPLYPDRLAEDLLALTLPGHSATGFPAAPWARPTALILSGRQNGALPAYTARMITFLASAAGPGRWPHVAQHLNAILRADPALAVGAGGAALSALADVLEIETDVLRAVEGYFPRSDPDLDPGIARVAAVLTDRLLAQTDDPSARADLYQNLALRLANAGLYPEAATAAQQAVDAYPLLGPGDPEHVRNLAFSLHVLGSVLWRNGQYHDALAQTQQAVALRRFLSVVDDRPRYAHDLAHSLINLNVQLAQVGQDRPALDACVEATQILRRLVTNAELSGDARRIALATAFLAEGLTNLGNRQLGLGLRTDALATLGNAVEIYRRLVAGNTASHSHPDGHSHDFDTEFANALSSLGIALERSDRAQEAVEPLEQAVAVCERLAVANPARYEPVYTDLLSNLAAVHNLLGHHQEAAEILEKTLTVYKRLATANLVRYEPDIARTLTNLSVAYAELGDREAARDRAEHSVALYRDLATSAPGSYEPILAVALSVLGHTLSALGSHSEAVASAEEAVLVDRRLAATEPAAHEPALARALDALAQIQERAMKLREAMQSANEALAIATRWAQLEPGNFNTLLNKAQGTVARIRLRLDDYPGD